MKEIGLYIHFKHIKVWTPGRIIIGYCWMDASIVKDTPTSHIPTGLQQKYPSPVMTLWDGIDIESGAGYD